MDSEDVDLATTSSSSRRSKNKSRSKLNDPASKEAFLDRSSDSKRSYGGTSSSHDDEYASADLESAGRGGGAYSTSGSDPARRKRRIIVSVGVALVIALVVVVVIFATKKSKSDDEPVTPGGGGAVIGRLPRNVIPSSYTVNLTVDLAASTFSGVVTIAATVAQLTDTLVFNAANLTISSTSIVSSDDPSTPLTPTSTIVDAEDEEVVLFFGDKLFDPAEKLTLQVQFNGTLRTDMRGLYRSTYTDPTTGATRVLAATQFEPTDARRAFPSFDEPAFKATFDVALTFDKSALGTSYFALSNMPVQSSTPVPNPNAPNATDSTWVRVTFATTPIMSTYLVAFVVCDFANINTTFPVSANPTPIASMGVYAEPTLVGTAQEALEVGANVTSFFGQLLNSPYPLPKEDMIAIPDFAAGAMENWGLVTYRRTALLVNTTDGSSSDRQRVALVVAHELAHQWFGDLVTCGWWNDLWLNEGFATFFEFLGVISARPDWRFDEQFITSVQQPAMAADSLRSSRSIIGNVTKPNEINSMFDTITYEKGGSVLRMIRAWLGEANFITGLQQYLNKFAYKNAYTQDLWDALQNVAPAGTNVTDVFDAWVRQPGFPVLTLAEPLDNTTWTLSQTRFFAARNTSLAPSTSLWNVPVQIGTKYLNGTLSTTSIVFPAVASITLTVDPTFEWVKLNYGQNGFFRVLYPDAHWATFRSALSVDGFGGLSLTDRAGLIDDAFSLAFAENLVWETALDFSKYLANEHDYVPWLTAWTQMTKVASFVQPADLDAFNSYGQELASGHLAAAVASLNKTSDHTTNLLIGLGLTVTARFNVSGTLARVATLFQQFRAGAPLWSQISATVLQYGIVSGTSADWYYVYGLFSTSTVAADRERYLSALASTTDLSLLTQLMTMTLNGTIPAQDVSTALLYVSRNTAAQQTFITFVVQNLDGLLSRLSGLNSFGRVLTALLSQISSPDQLRSVYATLSANPAVAPGGLYYTAALAGYEAGLTRQAFLSGAYARIAAWLQTNYGPPTPPAPSPSSSVAAIVPSSSVEPASAISSSVEPLSSSVEPLSSSVEPSSSAPDAVPSSSVEPSSSVALPSSSVEPSSSVTAA